MRKFVGMDFADLKALIVTGKSCVRCKHVKVDIIQIMKDPELVGYVKSKEKYRQRFEGQIEVVTDLVESHATKIVQALTKNNEVKVVLKPIEIDVRKLYPDKMKVIIDEVANVPDNVPEPPMIVLPNKIIPAQQFCPMCGLLLSLDVNIKNMYNCQGCKLAFGKTQLEVLERMELLPTRSTKEIIEGYNRARDNWGNYPDFVEDVEKMREPTEQECKDGLGALFGGEESAPGSLCKRWDGWYCTAPEVETETIQGCDGLLINCNNPIRKVCG